MLNLLTFLLQLSISYASTEPISLKQSCLNYLQNYPSYFKQEAIEQVCEKVQLTEGCKSAAGEPIFHSDYASKQANAKKILVISLIHGDETGAGSLGRFWLERLQKVDARNSWRIIPVANPDGVNKKTRTNANGIDLNRNFPTVDWSTDAIKYWEKSTQKNPRRFPGYAAGGEVETQCLMKQLEDYKPDFVVSIHTPLKVLDFDGPKLKKKIPYSYLPWKSLGNFPGSLGRYLWVERQTPVLTTELRETLPEQATAFEQLQDLVGSLVKKDLTQ
ncbi:MAG: DUF2817 domain-containing protein [Pseudobdellovibrio sp.]